MPVRRLYHEQPAGFDFTPDNLAWAKRAIGRYPEGRQASAVIPLLWKAQEQEGWVSEPAIRCVADMLGMPYIRVLEIATFYTMFQLQPVGRRAHVQVCGTTPCMLRGAGDLIEVCRKRIAYDPHELSPDGDFSWEEVECLGACVNAPMVQIAKDTYEDLTAESFEAILDAFANGETPKPGPQVDRIHSAPVGGPTVLIESAPRGGGNGAPPPSARASADSGLRESPTTPRARTEEAGKPSARDTGEAEASRTPAGAGDKETPETAALDEAHRPQGLDQPRGGRPDDLKEIVGIGPKVEGILNSLGIFHFDQIAAWTPENVDWVDGYLKFKGRIGREDWIGQARALAASGDAAFSKRDGKED